MVLIMGISIQNQHQTDPRLHVFSNLHSILLALAVKIACMHVDLWKRNSESVL
jgi:hypothetical protein